MKKLLNASFIYMLAGVASGLFYREFTKLNDFPEGQFTQLGLAHTHLLTLGFIVLLIVLALEKVFTVSRSPKLFVWFFWLYNAGVILTSAITAGMIVFFVALRRAVTGRTPVPSEAAAA